MKMSGREYDLDTSALEINHRKNQDWPHAPILGGMLVSLGVAALTGFKKARILHIASSLCFVGLTMSHFFIHHRQFSYRMKKILHLGASGTNSVPEPKHGEFIKDKPEGQ